MFLSKIDSFFKVSQRDSTFKKEIIGGLSTFLAMMYIFVINPAFLSDSKGIGIEKNIAFGAIFLGTVITTFVGTAIIGLIANVPVTLAPGMGLNSFFSYTVTMQFGLSYYQALVCVFISGILYLILAITPFRTKFNQFIPENLRISLIVMIGFFLAFVGLKSIGIVQYDPGTITTIGAGNFKNPLVIIGTITLIIGVILYYCKIKYSVIITTFIGLIFLLIAWPFNKTLIGGAFTLNKWEFGQFGNMISSMFKINEWTVVFKKPVAYVAIFTFLFVDFFDTSSTLLAIGKQANYDNNDTSRKSWVAKASYCDGASTVFGSVMLCSSVTTVSESLSGIGAGARTGLASLSSSLFVLLLLLTWPIMGPLMPIKDFQPVTGHAIFLTGLLMIGSLKDFKWNNIVDIPILGITIIFGMLGYSISLGLSWGVLTYITIYTVNYLIHGNLKEIKKISWLMWLLFIISILFIILDTCSKAKIFG